VILFRHLVVLLTLALWLPAANHCLLENLSFEDLDSCCATAESSLPFSSDHDCQTCNAVEDTGYKVEQKDSIVPARLPVELFFLAVTLDPPSPSFLEKSWSFPQTLAVTWQFSLRTALPVRSPSPIS